GCGQVFLHDSVSLPTGSIAASYSVRNYTTSMTSCQDLSPAAAPEAIPEATAKPRQLTRASITDTAIDFIEREGIERLSMRNLASAVGCGTMSLYSYVNGREDLIEAIIESLIVKSRLPALASQRFDSWQQLARELCATYRDLA